MQIKPKNIMDTGTDCFLNTAESISFRYKDEIVELNITDLLQALKTLVAANLEERVKAIEEELYTAEVYRMAQNE